MERLANFCTVADTGSIVGAAKSDPVRQSLISRQIRELESFFEVELVRRKGRGLELTEAGRELAAIGRQNFKGLSDYAARCQGAEWNVRVVASNSSAQWLLLPRLKDVSPSKLRVRFEIYHEQTHDMVSATREGTYDIAFVRRDALIEGLSHSVLGEIGHSLFIPKRLAKVAPDSVAIAMANLPMALPIGGKMREIMERKAEKAGQKLDVAVACSSYLQAAQILESGMCAAVLPDTALSALNVSRLHRIPIPDRYTLCLAWSARNADTRPALAGLIALLGKIMRVAAL